MSEAAMSEEKTEPKLPETPFNGIVVSVNQTEKSLHTGYAHISLAIVSEHDSSVIVFHGFSVKLLDPRRHLQSGHKVRVKKVELASKVESGDCRTVISDIGFETPIVCATVIDFDFKQLARGIADLS
jgi:hypothetical protein